jgi:hypothetical protein
MAKTRLCVFKDIMAVWCILRLLHDELVSLRILKALEGKYGDGF